MGSTYRRKIVAVGPDGRARDFTSEKQDGLWGLVGLEVDVRRRVLWANTGNLGANMPMVEPDPSTVGRTGLFAFDLASGRLLEKYLLGGPDERHFFNDLAVSSRGDVYITDSERGAVYTLDHAKRALEPLVPEGMAFANGIALGGDERVLYVAHFAGVSAVDLATREVRPISAPEDVSMVGVDGMVFHAGSLFTVGGIAGVHRVMRFDFGDDPYRVRSAEVLSANRPEHDLPTTGVMVEDGLYYIANSQLRSFDSEGRIFPAEKLKDVIVLRIPLRRGAPAAPPRP